MSRRRAQNKPKVVDRAREIIGVEDMILLQDVRDAGIAENLRLRLSSGEIYTYIGNVLIACNPYKWLKIYDESTMKKYVLQQRTDVEPHIFATAEAAYRGMVTEEESQCVIVSGESGAGKTEASKQIQNYIANVCGGGEGVDKIKEVFLRSNPVLEAFGNAKTLRNNNSSRFGKYFELKFNRFGSPLGGVITNYLLEKSRIVRPSDGERGFHIFYQLLSAPQRSEFGLTSVNDYQYLSCSNCFNVDGIDDAGEFNDTIAALKSVGMTNAQIRSILTLVAAVLQLGNVRFQPIQVEAAEGSKILNADPLQKFCDMAKLEADPLAHALTYRELQTMAPGGKIDTYYVPQNPIQASGRRDALAKSLYERLFDLIVNRINVALDPEKQASSRQASSEEMLSIGVLDIYGFEVFENNSFEQLCINYVNEKLQQIFIELTLRAEQDEYEREGIAWQPIPFFNNRIVCDLLDAARPSGIFRVLDDTSKTMHGARVAADVDKKFLETAQQVHGSHPHFFQNTRVFTIKHYAGDVSYTAGKFGETNKDALNKDLVSMLKTSTDRMINFLYPEEIDMDDKKAPPTAGFRIRTQCQALVTALMECSPHYVRCIKSNDLKQALTMNRARVEHQVKYLGLAENIKVKRAGFAYRAEYARFLDRFSILSPKTYPDWKGADKEGCREIIKSAAQELSCLTKEEAQLGQTKLFVRKPETYFALEKLRERKIGDFAVVIQRAWRKHFDSREFVKLQLSMAKLFTAESKSRRRDSIFRPYLGDYLDSLGPRAEAVREGFFRIIDHYSSNENVVFADAEVYQLTCSPQPPNWSLSKRLLVMTDAALYLFEILDASKKRELHPTKTIPDIVLRRRVALPSSRNDATNCSAVLSSISLSKLADPSVVLHLQPVVKLPQGSTTHFQVDKQVAKCQLTGTPFGLFTRRHHCRFSGGIYVDEVCNFYEPVPDLGYYQPVRVNDSVIGLSSTEQAEDIVLFCDKKTEFVGLLCTQLKRLSGASSRPPQFSDQIRLQGGPEPSLSRRPAPELRFVERNGKPGSHVNGREDVMEGCHCELSADKTILTVSVEPGLPHDVVEERRKRQIQRQKRKEAKRRREEEERRQRNAAREQEREADRLARLAEKKARKQTEKEAKRVATQEEQNVGKLGGKKSGSGGGGGGGGGRKFGAAATATNNNGEAAASNGGGIVSKLGGAGSELAAMMAKRRAAAGGN